MNTKIAKGPAQPENARQRARLRWLLAAMALLAVAVALVWWPGCRQYPPVTSRENLSLMKLLYSACSAQDPARLAKVEQGVARASREGKMTEPEQQAFAKVIALAREGQWREAEKAALRFAQDQVGQGR